MRSQLRAATLLATVLTTTTILMAGPLNPPAGPIAPTYKTLAEVEPRIPISAATTPPVGFAMFRITQPGSYYLTGNIQGISGKNAIEIAANNVSLDLGGFSVVGAASSLNGIVVTTGFSGASIRHGTVNGWSNSGIVANDLARISDIYLHNNAGAAIFAGNLCTIEDCTAYSNGLGIQAQDLAVIRHCAVTATDGEAISVGASARVEHCVAKSAGLDGIRVTTHGTVLDCTADSNGGAGIHATGDSSVQDCSASANTGAGFDVGDGVAVARCRAFSNAGPGISCGGSCLIEDNHCRANGDGAATAAGIQVATNATRTVIRGNNCVSNDWGIKVDGPANLVFGNRCSLNPTNYSIIANNRVAIILALPLSPAISGNSGGSAVSDPDANYAY